MKEGKAEIEVFDGVFFNPNMAGLRDISVSYINVLSNNASVLDATSATGIRGIRYALEANASPIFIEINKRAYENTVHNINLNRINAIAFNKSIQEFASSYDGAFDFIDLDPFGSSAPYIYDLLKVSKDGTRLMITATDTAVLCGADASACVKNYFSIPMHNELCHESGLRILLYFIARTAAQFNFGIEPELSIANMHYMRVFVKLNRGASEAVDSVKKCGYVLHCSKCRNFKQLSMHELSSRCDYCGSEMQVYGPIWLGELKENAILEKMISRFSSEYSKEALSLLLSIYEEPDNIFFFSIPKLTKYLRIGSVSRDAVANELEKEGFNVGKSHTDRNSVKGNFKIGDVINAIRKVST